MWRQRCRFSRLPASPWVLAGVATGGAAGSTKHLDEQASSTPLLAGLSGIGMVLLTSGRILGGAATGASVSAQLEVAASSAIAAAAATGTATTAPTKPE